MQMELFEVENKTIPMMPPEFKGKISKGGGYTKTAPREWTDKELEWCKKMKDEGFSVKQIAESMERSEVSISIKLKRLGKKNDTYNSSHVDEKYATNDAFFNMIKPNSVLDMYCGVKSYWNSRGDIPEVVTNDKDTSISAVFNEKSEKLIHYLLWQNKRFDIVDLDPYGSAYDCFDCAVKMAEKGLIITFGEMGHKRFKRLDFVKSHYNIDTIEDFITDNLIKEVQRIGCMNKKQLTPVFIKEWNRISRVYFSIEKIKITEQWECTQSR